MTRPAAAAAPRPLARLLALAAVLGTVGLGPLTAGTAAAATVDPSPEPSPTITIAPGQEGSPEPTPTAPPAAPVGTVTAELTMFPDPIATPGGTVRTLARVTNGTSTALDDARVELAVTARPLASPASVDSFLTAPAGLAVVASTPVGASVEIPLGPGAEPDAEPTTVNRLAAGTSSLVAVSADQAALALPDDAWGVYGVQVTLVTGTDRTVLSTGVITWEGAGLPTLEAAMLVTAAGPGADMSVIADSPGLRDVDLATDGTQLVGLDAGGVALSGRTVLRMPSYVPDVLSLAHAGDDSLLAFAVERARGTDGSVTHDAGWISPLPTVDASAVALLDSQGASAALIASSAAAGGDVVSAMRRESQSGLALLAAEPTLTEAITADGALEDPSTAVAKAALIAADADGPVLISPPAGWLTRGADTSALAAIATAPFITPVDIAALLDGDADPIDVPTEAQATEDDLPSSAIAGQAYRLERGEALAVTVEDPDDVLGPLGTMLLEPLATSLRDQPERREAALAGATVRAEELLGAISVPAGSDINLIAARGSVPVNVRNELPVPAEVTVDVTSFSPNLQVRDVPTVTVPARSSMTVLVEVEAVSTADVNASIVLRNTEGTPLSDSTALSVRVRADWGNAVTAVFTGGLVLLLIMGVIRTIRRGRKDTRTGPQPEDDGPGDDA